MDTESFVVLLKQWTAPGLSAAVALTVLAIAWRAGVAVLRRLTRQRPVAAVFVASAETPGLAVAALMVLQTILQSAPNELPWIVTVRHLAALVLIAAGTWLAVRMIRGIDTVVGLRHPLDVADNLEARRIQTQAKVLTRALIMIAVLVGISIGLLTFPGVRTIGASLLASAGLAGLVVGIAARPILGNLLAGMQLALTQPIRLDDVVVIEGEFGRIEEIGRTYVVVAIWDQRRLVVPLEYFIQKPLQNWTRVTSEILGTVFLWVDYGMPVDPLRDELKRICENALEWDRRVALIQVTDASEQAMQLRVLVSSADASGNWDLRCIVREGLIAFIRREYPAFLPRLRAELNDSREKPREAGAKPAKAERSRPLELSDAAVK
jgi:small-conductance mechanosensitive channel